LEAPLGSIAVVLLSPATASFRRELLQETRPEATFDDASLTASHLQLYLNLDHHPQEQLSRSRATILPSNVFAGALTDFIMAEQLLDQVREVAEGQIVGSPTPDVVQVANMAQGLRGTEAR
jgi:hypothetical protein